MDEATRITAVSRRPGGAVAVLRDQAPRWLIAVAVFALAYDNGGFAESTRDTVAIILLWVLILGIAFALWPAIRPTTASFVTGGCLAAFALWTLLSTIWASDAQGAYAEFTRVVLYLAVFAVATVGATRSNAASWVDGLALATVGITIVALVSRLFPSVFPGSNEEITRFLPGATTRLNFPIGYWNGLAIFAALGIPLLFRAAVAGSHAVVRGLALVPVPAIAGVIYLASSRTGFAAAVVGPVAFFLLARQRWAVAAAGLITAAGSVAVIAALHSRNALVNGPLSSSLADSQGHSAALLIIGICLFTGAVYGMGCWFVPSDLRLSPVLGWILIAAAVVMVGVGIASAHPVRRFEAFKKLPAQYQRNSVVQQHLLSGSGNGRWQLWTAAWKEFDSSPFHGRGAGSFQSWWLQHGSISTFVQDAHSLYLQVLGELGIVGFLLLAAAFVSGIVATLMRLLKVALEQRTVLAAAAAAFVGFAVAAASDWMWELPAVAVLALACLGLMTGSATAVTMRPRVTRSEYESATPTNRYVLGVGAIVCCWLLICAVAIPLLAGERLRSSHEASARGDAPTAIKNALDAKSIQPWASAPYLQVALVTEQAGRYGAARLWIRRAIARARDNWQLWFVQSRIETELGNIAAARRSLDHARALNPRSPVFRD